MRTHVQALPDDDGTRIILCTGEFDVVTSVQLDSALAAAAEAPGVSRTVVDLSQVSFADSTLLNTLVRGHRTQHMIVAGPLCPQLRRILRLSGLDTALRIAPDLRSTAPAD
ncbi:STAS domain-containing protein [Streptomyces sp. NPDC016309]|uniref:STAS domain-containing protein n=1 Tax=Streptomyces sp. NPDC016309 TaxID=3364965 RepID=UPI0036FFFA35